MRINLVCPYSPRRANELDFLLCADIGATARSCLDFSRCQPGDTVAVFGADPVSLLCACSAILRGASKVYFIDHVSQCLELAASIGAIPINFIHFDPVDFLKVEPQGVNRSCDCCGYEAVDRQLRPDSSVILRNAVRVTGIKGGIGLIGGYVEQTKSPGRPNAGAALANPTFPFVECWFKGLTMEGGPVNGARLVPILQHLIISGRAKPSFIVSIDIGIDDAPEGYKRFSA